MIHLNEQQQTIIYIYNLEQSTGKRHWEWDPEDPHIYMEWLNGTTILRNKIAYQQGLSDRQKAMNNNLMGLQQGDGNQINQVPTLPIPQGAGTGKPAGIKTGSSGKVYDAATSPHLFRPPSNRKRYSRRRG